VAPEAVMGNYNAKIDVWSMGCVMLEMATAKDPWSEHKFANTFSAMYFIGKHPAFDLP
jgi:serine/threonine protein kinase